MIRIDAVTKTYPGTDRRAIDDLTIEVPEGTTVALIGPSGCGKTTTMRLVNRLEVPTSGRVFVEGEDVASIDQVQLRRKIGYVIQQIGLFPHLTVARNIATVPQLLGWKAWRTQARVDELLHLVGLDPATMRNRYPHELSGGQRQRVGVARALAADPPVMLMDEPFGAIDPITRVRLQDEFKRILQAVRKTVLIVTHDLDEAIKMGDRVAIMRDGRLLQYDSPDRILARPADSFVESFVGADRALKRLSLVRAADFATPGEAADEADLPTVPAESNLRDALSVMLAQDAAALAVIDGQGQRGGTISRAALFSMSTSPVPSPDGPSPDGPVQAAAS